MALENIQNGNLDIEWTAAAEQRADGIRKALNSNGHAKFIAQLALDSS